MDLTQEKWLPVLLADGTRTRVSLSELFNNNIIDVAYPRADFQGAAWQMLIGLLQCTVAPEDEDDWEEIWDDGIDPEEWAQALNSLAPALHFSPEKPSFLQSFEPLESESSPISGLLIDAPGGNTLKLNKDHFVKRGSVEQICSYCAVMALFAVQTNSPAGGAGYRVGMRGGGPLTTLVVPLEEDKFPLWKKLWLNVLPQEDALLADQFPAVFPWLAATKTSEKAGNLVTPENAHPLQAYWGMPRRIELDFNDTQAGICDLCGESHDDLLRQMRVKNYGVQYEGWLHPLSPYRQALKDPSAPWLALKGQPGGLSYKDWLGLLVERVDKFNKNQPAKVVRAAASRSKNSGLWCFAWDMDNAKARCWYQHRIPLIHVDDPEPFLAIIHLVLQLASETLTLLRTALKSAKFENPKEAKADFSMVDIAFWQESEPAFRALLDALMADPQRNEAATRRAIRQWEIELHTYALHAFDRDALTDPDSPTGILLRQIEARRVLDSSYCKLKARKDVLAQAEEEKETTRA
jgi:CRISPR system Cascade subunit CasA